MRTTLTMTGAQHAELQAHLFPGDGLEAVAFALCGRHAGKDVHRLLVQRVALVPHAVCRRARDRLTWPSEAVVDLLMEASRRGLSVVKFHSHPGGYERFSEADDVSDKSFFESVHNFVEQEGVKHASAVMLPSGELFGRVVKASGTFEPLGGIAVIGDDLKFWRPSGEGVPGFQEAVRRHAQLFGASTTERLGGLTVAVVGCSGTGSIVIEQLARLGVARLVLVDPDKVEIKNLNRILNTRLVHATAGTLKVDVLAEAIRGLGLGTEVLPLALDLHEPEALMAVAGCDLVFGCMDSVDGRHLLNRLATFYLLPYIDLGVRLVADGNGGVSEVSVGVHYLQPGRSSLLSRRLYSNEALRAAYLKRHDPEHYDELVAQKYIKGANEDRPAVISVNMLVAALAVNEFLARLHPYRHEPNGGFAATRMSLSASLLDTESEMVAPCPTIARYVGSGDVEPMLDMTMFSKTREVS